MTPAAFHEWLANPNRPTLVMGVLNVTPDSFSDGGQFDTIDNAVTHARKMVDHGVQIIDIGGESTRPGAARIDSAEQIRRVIPVIRALGSLNLTLSVDTTRAAVAEAALDAGATIVNDISAGQEDPGMIPLAARRACPVILMHMQGEPGTMQNSPAYADVVTEIHEYLMARANAFKAGGVDRGRILLDPGIGFGKTVDHNLLLLKNLPVLVQTGYPVLVATSRKSFIGKTLNLPNAADRLHGTSATVAWAVANGAAVVRVHDVEPMTQVVKMIRAILNADASNVR